MFMRFKPFLITFLICLILFGSLLGVSIYLVGRTDAEPVAEPVQQVPVQTYKPQQQDNIALALLCCEEREGLPSAYFFLKFDVLQGKLFLVEIPSNTLATVNTSTKTIEEFYLYGGMEFAASAIGNLFLQERCYYLRTDAKTMQEGLDVLEGIPYTFRDPVETERYSFPAGEQQIDGNRFAALLLSETFYDKTDLLSAVAALRLNDRQVYRLDTLYDALFACDTDLTRAQLTGLSKAVSYALRLPMTTVSFPLQGLTQNEELRLNRDQLHDICVEMAG